MYQGCFLGIQTVYQTKVTNVEIQGCAKTVYSGQKICVSNWCRLVVYILIRLQEQELLLSCYGFHFRQHVVMLSVLISNIKSRFSERKVFFPSLGFLVINKAVCSHYTLAVIAENVPVFGTPIFIFLCIFITASSPVSHYLPQDGK